MAANHLQICSISFYGSQDDYVTPVSLIFCFPFVLLSIVLYLIMYLKGFDAIPAAETAQNFNRLVSLVESCVVQPGHWLIMYTESKYINT